MYRDMITAFTLSAVIPTASTGTIVPRHRYRDRDRDRGRLVQVSEIATPHMLRKDRNLLVYGCMPLPHACKRLVYIVEQQRRPQERER